MHWSIWAHEFQALPDAIKLKMYVYLSNHGANPEHMRGFTFDMDAHSAGIWVEYIEVSALGQAQVDQDYQPRTISEWITLEDVKGKDRPDFLEWMSVGADPPVGLGPPGQNPHQPFVHLKDSEWGS